VANIQSGNFCMVSTFTTFQLLQNALICLLSEVVFADDKEGKIQVQCALGCCHLTPRW